MRLPNKGSEHRELLIPNAAIHQGIDHFATTESHTKCITTHFSQRPSPARAVHVATSLLWTSRGPGIIPLCLKGMHIWPWMTYSTNMVYQKHWYLMMPTDTRGIC